MHGNEASVNIPGTGLESSNSIWSPQSSQHRHSRQGSSGGSENETMNELDTLVLGDKKLQE